MSKYSRKFKRALALVLTFVMAVSVITVTPSTNVEAASNKVVKSLAGVPAAKTMNVGETTSIKANVKTTKKVAKNLLQVTVKSSDSSVVAAKVAAKPKNKKKAKKGASTINLTAGKAGTATITVTTKAKNKKNKKVTKKMVVTVAEPTTQATTQATTAATTQAPNNNTNEKPQTPPEKVSVKGVTLDAETLNLDVNKGSTLVATVTPANATDKSVVWTSDNNAVASVDAKGNVKAVAVGEATITVTTNDGGYQAYCKVTVKDSSLDIADGMTMTVTNALEDYSNPEKSDYVCLTGSIASVRVRVIASGKPYTNQKVMLSIAPQYGNNPDLYKIESKSLTDFVTTDENGYATFPISKTDEFSEASATSGYYQSYSMTAQLASDTKVSTTATLSFGTISLISPHIVMFDDEDDEKVITNLEPGKNAVSSNDGGIAWVAAKNNAYQQEYVTNQQVSLASENINHSVTMATYPIIRLPRTASDVKTGKYEDKSFAKKSGAYSVYNDETNETTTTVIDTIPAGLEWATLYFDSIVLSDYTKMAINFYKMDESGSLDADNLLETKIITSKSGNTKSVQIPIQRDVDVCAVIALYSEGQIDVDSNAGYSVTGIEGEWASNKEQEPRMVEVKDSVVKWSLNNKFTRTTEDAFTLTVKEAAEYLPKNSADVNNEYTYSYEVPAFPAVGNAVITVKDANKNVKAYYTYPIKKLDDNTNDIADPDETRKAVSIGVDGYQKVVGSVSGQGAFVTVDSVQEGYTPLKATVDLSNLGVKISNPEAFSYIQWAPYVTEVKEVKAVDFYALKGQKVKVVAQLWDEDEVNKPTDENKSLTFTTKNGRLDDFVTSSTFSAKTNTDGQVVFDVKQTNDFDYIKDLHATAEGYKVKLTIGGQTIDKATIHWIEPGLYYKNAVDSNTAVESYDVKSVVQAENRAVGNKWIFGMKTIGNMDALSKYESYVITNISGIDIQFTKNGVGSIVDDKQKGQATITSETIGTTNLTGRIDSTSIANSSDVKFTIAKVDEYGKIVKEIGTFANVGEDDPVITAAITLAIDWTEKGLNTSIELPLGKQLDATVSTMAYIKIVDNYGNKLAKKEVTYSVSALGAIEEVKAKATTDENGLIPIKLVAPGVAGTVKIAAEIAGMTANNTIAYTVSGADPFSITKATLNKGDGTIKVSFTNTLYESFINKDAFTIVYGDKKIAIDSVSYDKNEANIVTLKLSKADDLTNAELSDVIVSVGTYKKDGLIYQMKDINNQILTGVDSVELTE